MRAAARLLVIALTAVAAACGGSRAANSPLPVLPEEHPLSALASTGAIVTPTYTLRVDPAVRSRIGAGTEILRALDDDIASALVERGFKNGWVMPTELATSYKRNPTYAANPYALDEAQLNATSFVAGSRLTEPLASQLRTMIALHENARYVLAPIELRFDQAASSTDVRASLRLALIDPRFSEGRWVGTVKSDTVNSDPRALTRALAVHVADLIVSR